MPVTKNSPSQIKTYLECPRKWYYRYILKQRSPPTAAQQFGTAFHQLMEDWLNTGELPCCPEPTVPHVRCMYRLARLMIDSGHLTRGERIIGVELDTTRDAFTFGDTGVMLNGRIDVVERLPEAGAIRINDFKTTSGNYLTQKKLRDDVQAICYGAWAVDVYDLDEVAVRLLYANHKRDIIRPVEVWFSKEEINEKFARLFPHVEVMKRWREEAPHLSNIERVESACYNWGGCDHLSPCVMTPFTSVPHVQTKGEPTMPSDLIKRMLAEKNAAAVTAAELEDVQVSALAPTLPEEEERDGHIATIEEEGALPTRAVNALINGGIHTQGDLACALEDGTDLGALKGMGPGSLAAVMQYAEERGLVSADRPEPEPEPAQDIMQDASPTAVAPAPIESNDAPIPCNTGGFILYGCTFDDRATPNLLHYILDRLEADGALKVGEYYNVAPYNKGIKEVILPAVLRFKEDIAASNWYLDTRSPASGAIVEIASRFMPVIRATP